MQDDAGPGSAGVVRQAGRALTAWLLRIGLVRAVLVIAGFSVISSVLITGVSIHLTLPRIALEEWLYFAILTPAVISPLVGVVVMSLAYRLADAQRALASLARTDPLTGIGNRRHFIDSAEAFLALAAEDADPIALLMLDIDHFKQLNDRYGHAAGDAALIAVAQCCSRRASVLGRWGGEEFCILLPATATGVAAALAEQLREDIAALAIPAVPEGVTVSIGVAAASGERFGLDDLLSAADRQLYRAKAAGRNRVSSAPPADSDRPGRPAVAEADRPHAAALTSRMNVAINPVMSAGGKP